MISCTKLFFKRPGECQPILGKLIVKCVEDNNVDVKDRANKGDRNAQYNLGVMYRDGQGVAKDYEQAVLWYRKAAEQGFAT